MNNTTRGAGVLLAAVLSSGVAEAQTTVRVSVSSNGAQGSAGSWRPSISADGLSVAFYSLASNLVTGDTNGYQDVFVHDGATGATARISLSSAGAQGNYFSHLPSMSADGRFVAFTSLASNLVSGDTNSAWDSFVRDLQNGTTERVSVDSSGGGGDRQQQRRRDLGRWPLRGLPERCLEPRPGRHQRGR